MKELLKSYYGFSNYQIAQLEFFFKTVFSEISKILIMGVFFRNELDIYFITLLAMCFLRTSTGGLHCKTYWGCLSGSTVYMVISIKVLPLIPVPVMLMATLLIPCIFINYLVGPVTSDVHMPLTTEIIKKSRIKAALFIALYTVVILVFPKSVYTPAIFWITIIHTLQLIAAKIRKNVKGGNLHETETD